MGCQCALTRLLISSSFPSEVESFGDRSTFNVAGFVRLLEDFSVWALYSGELRRDCDRITQQRQSLPTGCGNPPLLVPEGFPSENGLAVEESFCS